MTEIKTNDNAYSIDIRKLSVNLFTAVTIIGFIIWMTLYTVQEKENLLKDIRSERSQSILELKQEIHEMKDDILRDLGEIKTDDASHHDKLDWLTERLKEMTAILNRTIKHHEYLADNVWTKNDLALWCYEVQNKNKDFVCPDYETLKRLGLFGDGERFNHKAKQPFSFEEDKKFLEDKKDEKKK